MTRRAPKKARKRETEKEGKIGQRRRLHFAFTLNPRAWVGGKKLGKRKTIEEKK